MKILKYQSFNIMLALTINWILLNFISKLILNILFRSVLIIIIIYLDNSSFEHLINLNQISNFFELLIFSFSSDHMSLFQENLFMGADIHFNLEGDYSINEHNNINIDTFFNQNEENTSSSNNSISNSIY